MRMHISEQATSLRESTKGDIWMPAIDPAVLQPVIWTADRVGVQDEPLRFVYIQQDDEQVTANGSFPRG